MLGILKCVSGALKIKSYTRLENSSSSELLVTPEEPRIIDHRSPCTFLDEKTCNFHEIAALDQPAAFFDVLSPPYTDITDEDPDVRQCHFYKKLMVSNDPERTILKLEKIECPQHYFCDSIYFKKPEYME